MTVLPNTASFTLNHVLEVPLVFSYGETPPQLPGQVLQLHLREKQPHQPNLQPGLHLSTFLHVQIRCLFKNTLFSPHSFLFLQVKHFLNGT